MNKAVTDLIKTAIKEKVNSPKELHALKNRISSKYGIAHLTNLEIIEGYKELLKNKEIIINENLEKIIRKRSIRTLSGIAPVAVLTKPYDCPGECTFCPTEKEMPKSYLSNEPAVMRAILNDFNPYKQVLNRIHSLALTGHDTGKVEIIVMGGTFNYFTPQYQSSFVKRCFQGLNAKIDLSEKIRTQKGKDFYQIKEKYVKPPKGQSLKEVQKINEKSQHRCVGLTLETRPDYIDIKELKRFRQLGCTKLEVGVQNTDNTILKKNKRGHLIEQTIEATKLMKDSGFKVCYHMMPNLPGSDFKKDVQMFWDLFNKPDFQPDLLKIYPCVVTEFAEIAKWWRAGEYKPYKDAELLQLLLEIKKDLPTYVRVIRVIRDIPAESIIAGSKISNLRQLLHDQMKQEEVECQCIRCREIRSQNFDLKNVKLIRKDYDASDGKEIFLSFEDVKQNKLISMLRLRIPSQIFERKKHFIKELNNAAIIREVHTYGEQIPIGKTGKAQHFGFGRKLLKEGEKIVKSEYNLPKISVISGIGVREYYRKNGYKLKGTYMQKTLNE